MNDQLFHNYLQLSRLFINKLNEQLAAHDLFHSQWLILNHLNKSGASTLVEIAHYLHVEKSAITRTVSRLEKSQFIEQIAAKDKRERRMQLTKQGEEKYRAGRKIVDEVEQRALFGISEEEQERFSETISNIRDNLSK